jgi:flagellar hook-associated protein 1 FlgK
MTNLLSIGKTGLLAAQAGLTTTGHNISNSNVAGYSRQAVVQQSAQAQNLGNGFMGNGTDVAEVKRYYDNFLATQVRSAQSSTSSLDAFNGQISQIDDMMADSTSGVSPVLQDFFKGVQDLSANPTSTASRQSLLSSASSLAARFQGMSARLTEISDGVNSRISADVNSINTYAHQIAALNDSISSLGSSDTMAPNDMLDQRDQLVNQLNTIVNATVTPGDRGTISVSIGAGQPLLVGSHVFDLAVTSAPTDPGRVEVGYNTGAGKVTVLPDTALTGGELGGLMDFRSSTLDETQKSLGRIALGVATAFNTQNSQGQDLNGAMGGDVFKVGLPAINPDVRNNPTSTTALTATVSDASQLTTSDYSVRSDGTNFTVVRLSDGKQTAITPYPQLVPQTVDGVDYTITGAAAAGDNFTVKPTLNGAADFSVVLTDRSKIAAGGLPLSAASATLNTGNAAIGTLTVDKNFMTANPLNGQMTINPLAAPVTLTYSAATATLSGFPVTADVTVTSGGVDTVYPADPAGLPLDIPYTPGDTVHFSGINVPFSGTPADLDQFTISPVAGGVGDNRNALLMGKLQTTNTLEGGKTTFQGAYAETVAFIGNKTREMQTNGDASTALLAQTTKSQQDVSGVNLDEEAANMLRYQQAYQACGKVMQIASTLFDVLLTLGR